VVNEIIDISFGDKSTRNWHLTGGGDPVIPGAVLNAGAPVNITINGNRNSRGGDNSHAMFGGDESGGGVGANPGTWTDKGEVRMYWGFDDATAQPVDEYFAHGDVYVNTVEGGWPATMRWPQFAYMRMGSESGVAFYIAAADGNPKPMKLLLRRTAWWDIDNTGALSPLGQSAAQATIGTDANPAEVIYDLLTHKGYGLGRDPEWINVDSFISAAATLRTEAFGISVLITKAVDAASVIKDILKTIDATLCTSPVTGQLRLKLIRPDYVVADLLHLTASNSSKVKYAPSTWRETVNEVRVTYRRFINTTEKRGFIDDIVTDQDLANYNLTGRVRNLVVDLPYLTDPVNAALACARIRRAYSVPLARYSWRMNREGFTLMQGDAVHAVAEAFGLLSLVLRVTNVNYGTLEEGEIVCEGVQDVFSVTEPTTVVPTTVAPPPAAPAPEDNSGEGTIPENADGVNFGGF
jgi:hypothetical protein